ncbi:type IX secretion system plug protein domain-containing protein [Alistipes sp. ZOR0009]|uniref:type IX secretion system plug protein n=1 Tax=Alistipes sp. ZOR0009 TaxID=1339253 RepID=UPI0006470C49|nr:type IX secretion system plug protein domain-containing protein [Alistipes sp. ZOR0009]
MRFLIVTSILFFCFLFHTTLHAQNRVEVIDPEIKTVQAYTNNDILTYPSIYLNSGDQITIAFDDLNSKAPRNLMYKVIHCDQDWADEGLFAADFLTGFQEQYLYNTGFSSNTSIRYVHYKLQFPNNDVSPKVSGNYMIVVYNPDNQEPLLKVGFHIVENLANLAGSIIIPNDRNYETSQQLNLLLKYPLISSANPNGDFKIRVSQNYEQYAANRQPTPTTYGVSTINYSRADRNIYPAGNEFRTLDIRDVHYLSTNASSVRQVQGEYFILLQPDLDRASTPYSSAIDYNGKMVIAGLNATNPDTESDYYSVLFSLKSNFLGNQYDVFLEGELTGWGTSNVGKMIYNSQTGCYETPLTLKQGYYSYRYVVRDAKGVEQGELSPEGNFSETENTYQVGVYYKSIRDTYTRLVASITLEKDKKLKK